MQHILGLVRRCVEDYHMIEPGETVAVGVSGGKDSLLTLTALARLRRFYPVPFQVHAITLETGTPGMSFDAVADLCRDLEVPYTRISVPVYQIVFEERKEKNPCSLCAGKSRQGVTAAQNDPVIFRNRSRKIIGAVCVSVYIRIRSLQDPRFIKSQFIVHSSLPIRSCWNQLQRRSSHPFLPHPSSSLEIIWALQNLKRRRNLTSK